MLMLYDCLQKTHLFRFNHIPSVTETVLAQQEFSCFCQLPLRSILHKKSTKILGHFSLCTIKCETTNTFKLSDVSLLTTHDKAC